MALADVESVATTALFVSGQWILETSHPFDLEPITMLQLYRVVSSRNIDRRNRLENMGH